MHFILAILMQIPAILMYHQVDDREPPGKLGRALTISPAELRMQLEYLHEHRLRAVSVDDFIRASRAKEPTSDMVILTFDDGYQDQYTQAFPILLEYGARATFFITTGNVGKPNHVTWPQIRTMERSGMSIGGHNVDHIDLSSLSPQRQRYEIEGCLNALREHVGIVPDTYAYPGGTFNRQTETLLESEPIELAFTTDPAHALGYDSRLEVSRIRVIPENSITPLSSELTLKRVARLRAPLR